MEREVTKILYGKFGLTKCIVLINPTRRMIDRETIRARGHNMQSRHQPCRGAPTNALCHMGYDSHFN